ncbi:MAG: YceI family protein [Bacteroidota bacterium]
MRRHFINTALAALVAIIAFGFVANTAETTYTVDTSASKVLWEASKVTGTHSGTVNISEGAFEFDGETLTGGSFVVDMASIACTDLPKNKGGAKLEGHLKSADFFGVEEFPTAMLAIKRVIPYGKPGEYRIVGDITIKGATKEVKFNASIMPEGASLTAKAELELDRTDFDVRYGSGSFFEDLGDKTIYDEFSLTFEVVANQAG